MGLCSEGADRSIRTIEALTEQLWALLPAFCNRATDVNEVKFLTSLLPKFRLHFFTFLSLLINISLFYIKIYVLELFLQKP